MRFLHGKVKAKKGQSINVNFSAPTRILVLTKKNFEKYKNNLTFTYYGGEKEESPYSFNVPQHGLWYVVVEKGSYYEPIDLTASIELATPEPTVLPRHEAVKEEEDEEFAIEAEDEEEDD